MKKYIVLKKNLINFPCSMRAEGAVDEQLFEQHRGKRMVTTCESCAGHVFFHRSGCPRGCQCCGALLGRLGQNCSSLFTCFPLPGSLPSNI